jgi:hypothetical protein
MYQFHFNSKKQLPTAAMGAAAGLCLGRPALLPRARDPRRLDLVRWQAQRRDLHLDA